MNKNNLKHVIKITLLIFTTSFVIDKAIFKTLNTLSDKVLSGQGIGKLNHFMTGDNEKDFYIFGSSRSNHSLNPAKISNGNGFNMGVDGTKIAYAQTLIKLLPKEKKQTIILNIDETNFFDNEYTGKDILYLNNKYSRVKTIKNEINKINQNNFFQKIYWSIGYNGKILSIIKNLIKPKYNHLKYTGYDPIYVTSEQKKIFNKIISQKKRTECDTILKPNKLYDNYLDELKHISNQNNKRIILFTAPVYNDYCKDDNLEMTKILNKKGIEYHDFSDFFNDKNSVDYWKDETHLSNIGAEIFTEEINKFFN